MALNYVYIYIYIYIYIHTHTMNPLISCMGKTLFIFDILDGSLFDEGRELKIT